MVNENEKLVYSVEQAGELLGLSRPSAYLAVKRGEIPVIKFGRRLVVPKAALDKLLVNAGQSAT